MPFAQKRLRQRRTYQFDMSSTNSWSTAAVSGILYAARFLSASRTMLFIFESSHLSMTESFS